MVFMDFVVFGIYQVFILYTKKPLPLHATKPGKPGGANSQSLGGVGKPVCLIHLVDKSFRLAPAKEGRSKRALSPQLA